LHPSRRHGNTSRHFSEFEKMPAFLRRHGVGRQLAPVRTSGQHCPKAEILDKEIACIHSASVRTTGQHRPDAIIFMAITCRQPSGRGLNMETREARYGKPVAQKTFQTLNASVRTPHKEIRDRLNLGFLIL
jgi:hypothetical protein